MARAKDIADLERMLDDGEGDSSLNQRAIEILERIEYEGKLARQNMNIKGIETIEAETKDFERVIADIQRRRHEHVLDTFTTHAYNKKKGRRS